MKWKRLGSSTLVMVLVCCLIFNMATVPVYATSPWDPVYVLGENLLAGILRALGVEALNATEDLLELAADAWTALRNESRFVDRVAGNTYKLLVGKYDELAESIAMTQLDTILFVWNWLFDSGKVTESMPSGATQNVSFDGSSYEIVGEDGISFRVACFRKQLSSDYAYYQLVAFSKESGRVYVGGTYELLTLCPNSEYYTATIALTGKKYLEGAFTNTSVPVFDVKITEYFPALGSIPLKTGLDVAVDSLLHPSVGFSTGYADWSGTTQTLTDELGQTQEYVQLGLGETLDETLDKTQTELQTGTTSITIDTTQLGGTTWVTFKQWLQGLFSGLTNKLELVTTSITDFFTFDTDLSLYTVELTSFFPFCIPWDIYNFFALLSSEPEAPYLEFDIDFPYMDEPWHLVIDLSAWDGVAKVARRFELIAFCVGLAMFTREKFLRG